VDVLRDLEGHAPESRVLPGRVPSSSRSPPA
jgi:hypothetical protein